MVSFQIRHKEFGVFQGECMGMGFWHPMSDMPEQGFCEISTEAQAQEYINNVLCVGESALQRDDLTIEPYDRFLSESLRASAK